MKFLHAADLHIDSPMIGLDRYEGAPVDALRGASRRAMENLVDLAIREPVQFVVIAGDVFDGNWKDYNTGLFFQRCMSQLREADIPVWMISGNHDAASRVSRSLTLPENVHRFSDANPGTDVSEALGIAFHGRGFKEAKLSENVVPDYPDAVANMFNIGLLHTSLGGTPANATYAPCKREDLHAKGYDYWALGHVHTRQIIAESPSWIVHPGNPQGRHIRETGPRGCMVVKVDDGRQVTAVRFRELDVVRWEHLKVNAAPHSDVGDVLEAVRGSLENAVSDSDGRMLAVRVEVQGTTEAHSELAADPESWRREVQAAALDVAGEQLWIEKTRISTKGPSQGTVGSDDILAKLLTNPPEEHADLFAEIEQLQKWLPNDVAKGVGGLRLASDAVRRELIDHAKELARETILRSAT